MTNSDNCAYGNNDDVTCLRQSFVNVTSFKGEEKFEG